MSKEQIEEMAKVIRNVCENHRGIWCTELAKVIYNAGYRKQIEGEWTSQADGTHYCSNCGHDATYTFDGTEICGVACPFCGAKMKGGE